MQWIVLLKDVPNMLHHQQLLLYAVSVVKNYNGKLLS